MLLKNIISNFLIHLVPANAILIACFYALITTTFLNYEPYKFWFNFIIVISILCSFIITLYLKFKYLKHSKFWLKCLIFSIIACFAANTIFIWKESSVQKALEFKGDIYVTSVEKTQFGTKIYILLKNSIWQLILPSKAELKKQELNSGNFEPGKRFYAEGVLKFYEYSLEKEFGTKEFYQNIARTNALNGEFKATNLSEISNCDIVCLTLLNINTFKINQLKTLQNAICNSLGEDWQSLAPFSNCIDILALSQGLVLGGSNGFSPEMKLAFQKTGLTHIVAISGFNISLIIVLIQSVLSFIQISFKWRFPLSLLIIIAFVILVTPSASVVRAAFMGIILIFAKVAGRPCSGIRALLLSAVLMLFINPYYIYSVSFLLSFLATFGLLNFVNLNLDSTSNWLKSGLEIIWGTITANLFTLPILINVFGYISPLSFIPNLIILPFVPFLMLGNTLGLLPAIGEVFIFLTGLTQAWLLGLIQLFSQFLPVIFIQPLKVYEVICWYFVLYIFSNLVKQNNLTLV